MILRLSLTLIFISISLNLFSESKRGQASIVVNEVKSKREVSRFRKVHKGQLFRDGDIIFVEKQSFLEIILFNQKKIRVFEDSVIEFIAINDGYAHIKLRKGKLEALASDEIRDYITFLETDTFIASNQKDEGTIKLYSDNVIERIIISEGLLYIENLNDSLDNFFLQNNYQFEKLKKQKLENGKITRGDNEVSESIPSADSELKSFDKKKLTLSNPNDPFFKENQTFEEKRDIIKLYRKQKHFYLKSDLGFAYISDDFYASLGFYPLFLYDQFQLQLRFMFYFSIDKAPDLNSIYNNNEWDFRNGRDIVSDILSKIDFMNYQSSDSVFNISLKQLESISYGYGLTVNRYSNTIFSPYERQTGLTFKIDYESLVLNGFVTNISDPNLMAFRLETYPFLTEGSNKKEQTTFGFTFLIDLSPKSNQGNPEIYMGSLDFNIPFLGKRGDDITLGTFLEFAFQGIEFNSQTEADRYSEDSKQLKIIDNSFGVIIGLKSKVIDLLELRFDYRYLAKGFTGNYMDVFYDIQKSEKANMVLVEDKEDFQGFLGAIAFDIKNYAKIYIEYYYETGSITGYEKDNNRLHIDIESSPFLDPGFVFSFHYDQRAFNTFKDLFNGFMGFNSIYNYRFRYSYNENLDLILNWKQFFENQSGVYKNEDLISFTVQYLF